MSLPLAEGGFLLGDLELGATWARLGLDHMGDEGDIYWRGELAVQLWRCAGTRYEHEWIGDAYRWHLDGELSKAAASTGQIAGARTRRPTSSATATRKRTFVGRSSCSTAWVRAPAR